MLHSTLHHTSANSLTHIHTRHVRLKGVQITKLNVRKQAKVVFDQFCLHKRVRLKLIRLVSIIAVC